MLACGNISGLITRDDLISIEREAEFGFTRRPAHGNGKLMGFDVCQLDGQRTRLEFSINRCCAQLEHGRYRQYDGNQRDETQHA